MLPTNWKYVPSHSTNLHYESDKYISINPSITDTSNHHEITSNSNNPIISSSFDNVNNDHREHQVSSQDSTHNVTLCLNDLQTTLFIDEDVFHNGKTINNNNNSTNNSNRKSNQ